MIHSYSYGCTHIRSRTLYDYFLRLILSLNYSLTQFNFLSLPKAIAYAKTPKGCNFRVQLFKPNHNFSGKRDGSVLVEVQRRSGCCVKFHALAMQILYAAKGCECPHHYAIDDHKQLKVPGCDLFEGASTSAHANLRQGTAY